MIIVVDSLSKEIVDKYRMKNVKKLMKDGVDTPRGYLGHTGSVTVVTHNVITSGQLPKHMGWTDEGYRDVAGILGDPEPTNPDQLYITSNATTDLFKLQQAAGYPKLADYLGAADPAAKTFTISPKGYAGYAFGGAGSDSLITFSSGPECTTGGGWRKPGGINVPSYILGTPCSRFWVHSGYRRRPSFAYDTTKLPAVLYPLDSDRYVTGHDPAHEGGDVWAADAAVEIMRNDPSWNGIFVTLPGVDKAAHMWGGVTDPGPTGADGDPMTHMAAATAEADRQVGKIMAELKARVSSTTRSWCSPPTTARLRASSSTASRSPQRTTATTTGTTATPRTTSSPTTSHRTPCCRSSTPATSGSPTATRCCASG